MKIIKYFKNLVILALAIVILSSCSDKNEEGISKADVVGNWTINSSTTKITINGMSLVDFYLATIDSITQEEAEFYASAYTPDLEGYMNFKSDNSYTMDIGGGEFSGRWTLGSEGKQILLDENTSYEQVMDLLSVCSTSMVLSYSFSYSGYADDDDEPDSIEEQYNLALIK